MGKKVTEGSYVIWTSHTHLGSAQERRMKAAWVWLEMTCCCCYDFQRSTIIPQMLYYNFYLMTQTKRTFSTDIPSKHCVEPTTASSLPLLAPEQGGGAGYFPQHSCRFGASAFWWSTAKELSTILHSWKILYRLMFLFKLRHKIKPCVCRQRS